MATELSQASLVGAASGCSDAASTCGSGSAEPYPAVFLFHGGGPLPLLGDEAHKPLVASWQAMLKRVVQKAGPPSAVVVVSAHFETQVAAVGGAAAPKMLYDYGGFPRESYRLSYPAPGCPELAARLVGALTAAKIPCQLEAERPFDHGVFVPMMVLFPDAKIPVVPLSVLRRQDAAEHISVGRALAPFRREKVLFVGSGASMHHFGNLFSSRKGVGTVFNDALSGVLCGASLSASARLEQMKAVKSFPGVEESHPPGGFEHLMPLLTLVGVADGAPAEEASNDNVMGGNFRQYIFWS